MERGSVSVPRSEPVRCTCAWPTPEHIANHREHTAAESAETLREMTWPAEKHTGISDDVAYVERRADVRDAWRAAAHYEGERYAEAIRGAREMRHAAAVLGGGCLTQQFHWQPADSHEKKHGLPANWINR